MKRKRTELTPDTWVEEVEFPEHLKEYEFTNLWNLQPTDYNTVMIMNREVKIPRKQASYMRDYSFSGKTVKMQEDVPAYFKDVLEWVNSLGYGCFNQIFVNWYATGKNYIGKHSDDEADLVRNSPILSISLGGTRTFRLTSKNGEKIKKDYSLQNHSVIVMGGKCQQEFKHEITKTMKLAGKRINLTFRQFVE